MRSRDVDRLVNEIRELRHDVERLRKTVLNASVATSERDTEANELLECLVRNFRAHKFETVDDYGNRFLHHRMYLKPESGEEEGDKMRYPDQFRDD